jgi:hypothetical protein
MKEKVTYFVKCMKCNAIKEYLMRDYNVNEVLTDSNIYSIIGDRKKDPYDINHCEECGIQTLQMHVGWDLGE